MTKKTKATLFLRITVVLLTLVAVFGSMVAAAPEETEVSYKAVVTFTLYEEADFSSAKLVSVPQNAVVTPVGEPMEAGGYNWQKVRYTTVEGYTLSSNIFISNKNDSFHFTVAKAKSAEMGEKIGLYSVHSETASPERYINDGEKIRIVNDGLSYGTFVRVEYDNEYYFVRAENVTTGLSYNQTLAVIITGSVVGGLLLLLIIVLAVRRRKKRI